MIKLSEKEKSKRFFKNQVWQILLLISLFLSAFYLCTEKLDIKTIYGENELRIDK